MELLKIALMCFAQSLHAMDQQFKITTTPVVEVLQSQKDRIALKYLDHKREYAQFQLSLKYDRYEDRMPYFLEIEQSLKQDLQDLDTLYARSQRDGAVAFEKIEMRRADFARLKRNQVIDQQFKDDVARIVLELQQASRSPVQTEQVSKKARVIVTTAQDSSSCQDVLVFDQSKLVCYQSNFEKYFASKAEKQRLEEYIAKKSQDKSK